MFTKFGEDAVLIYHCNLTFTSNTYALKSFRKHSQYLGWYFKIPEKMPSSPVIWRFRISYKSFLFFPPKFKFFTNHFSIGAMEVIRSRFFFETFKICDIFFWFQQHHFLISRKSLEQKNFTYFFPQFFTGNKDLAWFCLWDVTIQNFNFVSGKMCWKKYK